MITTCVVLWLIHVTLFVAMAIWRPTIMRAFLAHMIAITWVLGDLRESYRRRYQDVLSPPKVGTLKVVPPPTATMSVSGTETNEEAMTTLVRMGATRKQAVDAVSVAVAAGATTTEQVIVHAFKNTQAWRKKGA